MPYIGLSGVAPAKAFGWGSPSTKIYIATNTGSSWVQFEYSNMEMDSSGNIYLAGDWYATLSSQATIGAYTHKFSSQGVREFEKTLSTVGKFNRSKGTGLDSSGNIYGFGAESTDKTFFIYKYNNSGVLQWQKISSANANSLSAYGMTTDSSGNSYIAVLDNVGGSPQTWYGLLIKIDSTGALVWQKRVGTSGVINYFLAPHIDSSGNIYAVGYNIAGNIGVFKFDSSGNLTWTRRMVGGEGRAVTSDSSGNIYVASEGSSSQIMKINSSGTLQWQRKLATTGNTPQARAIYYDNDTSSLYVAGSSATSNNGDCFIAKYDSSGTLQWQRKIVHSSNNGDIFGLRVYQGKIIAAGQFGSGTFSTVLSLPSDGDFNGTYVTPSNGTWTISNGGMTESAGTGTFSTQTVSIGNSSFSLSNSSLTQDAFSTTARISRF